MYTRSAHILENLFFLTLFSSMVLVTWVSEKNHCRPWYILHNCKSTDLKTNLKHLDKVLHNHKHMLNNKMCFVREIESSFFWSELERMQIPQFNSARDRDGGKLRRNFWDSFAWFDPHSPRCSLYCCICTLSLYLLVLDKFMKKRPYSKLL